MLRSSDESTSSTLCLHAGLEDNPAAEQMISLKEDCRLPCRDISLWRIELDLHPIAPYGRDQRRSLFGCITNLDLCTKWTFWLFTRHPIDVARDELARTEL